MASDYGLVSVIKAPLLEKLTQPALIEFETEYAKYVRKVNDVNTNRPAADKLTVASISDCMDANVLHALCIMGKIDGATCVEEATPAKVQSWFDASLKATPTTISSRLKAAVASTKFKPCNEDPAGAVLTFCVDVVQALDQQNVSDILKSEEKSKILVDMLEEKIEPPLLRRRLRDERRFWDKKDKGSINTFEKVLSDLAVQVQQNEAARSAIGDRPKRGNDNSKEGQQNNKKHKGSNGEASPSKAANNGKSNVKKNSKEQWTKPCLNTACDKMHRLKDCEMTSPDEKKKLYEDYYQKAKQDRKDKSQKDPKNSAKAVREVQVKDDEPDGDEGRFRIIFEDKVSAVALGDSGADFSAMPLSMWERVKKEAPYLETKTFNVPLKLSCAFQTESDVERKLEFSAKASVTMCITLILPGSNIPVRIRGVEFLVTVQEMDEVLIGRPFLKAIGFDLKKHLESVRGSLHNRDIKEINDDPVKDNDTISAGIGKDDPAEIDAALEQILNNATEHGLSAKGRTTLKDMINKHRDVFRIRLSADPPAKVQPLKITLAENAQPFRSPQRRYAPLQREFIIRTIKELEAVGAVYKNPTARWASPALAVTKPGTNTLRFTVDLRGPNSRTVPIQSAMPHLESHMQDISGSEYFANLDLAHGYWQVSLSPESQEMMSIQTPLGVYSSNRLLQGGTDAGNHFQAVLQEEFEGNVQKMLQWIDDFFFYASTEEELLHNLATFLSICTKIGLKLHAKKCNFFSQEAQFCGRLISKDGIQYHPRHYEALLEMKPPTRADELQQFICATNWMRNSIPQYTQLIEPLHNLLETIYHRVGKRTKRAIKSSSLSGDWGAMHDSAFANVKAQLAAAVKLSHPKPNFTTCLFTDASQTHWSGVLTQVPEDQRRMDVEEQGHEPLCFLSGAFKGSAENWSVPEKEGFAIVEAMSRLDYLVVGKTISIYTDHANLLYIYDPLGQNPSMPRHTASKLMRWALKLSAFRYIIEHLPGERNVWADILTRWAVNMKRTVQSKNTLSAKALMLAPINPAFDSQMDWPSLQDFKVSQDKAKRKAVEGFTKNKDGIWAKGNIIWIPCEDEKLKLRILIAAHAGMAGHRGNKTTEAHVMAHFYWDDMKSEIKAFTSSCFHCLCSAPGVTVPRPLGHALHADAPNELLHFDFCYMSPGEDGFTYVLVLKDDLSSYVWLVPAKEATADVVSSALISWFSAFGVVNKWVSDRGTHFKNTLVKSLREALKSEHHFTLAYTPWSNGSVEVVNRELLKTTRAVLSEAQLNQRCWPSVLPIVQSALNSSVLDRLGGRSPLTVFTHLPPDNPLSAITRKEGSVTQVRHMNDIQKQQIVSIQTLQQAFEGMHKEVTSLVSKKRQQSVLSFNKKTGVRPINFTEGDFVLKGALQHERGRKPSLKWKGPYRVVECDSDYIFIVEDLLSHKREAVHGRRLKFFRNSSFEVSEEMLEHLAYQKNELLVIERIDDIRRRAGQVELLIKWKGFSEEENDWVALPTLREDVPVLVNDFLEELSKSGTARQKAIAASL